MKITLISAERAYRATETLAGQLLPFRIAKAICDNRKVLKDQTEFLITEEQKLVETYGAESQNGTAFKVEGDEDRNREFIQKMRELHEMEIDIRITPIPEEALFASAKIRPSEFDDIRFMLTNEEE